VEPLLAPIRRILPPTGPIDLSPMVLILGIALVRQMLVALILGLG
jgi:YggT family protein